MNGRKLTGLVAGVGAAVFLLALPVGVLASQGGDNNKGDVWVDNVGQPAGPGHEMDPHLACQDINLWGNALADPSGTYTIDGWSPSGFHEKDYPATGNANWTYNKAQGGDQVTDVIVVKTLIANAIANGDAPINKQGFHFKLQFSQDPQKHKTFWVNCPGPTSGTQGSTPTPTPTPTSGTQGTTTTPTPTATPGSGEAGAVQGISTTTPNAGAPTIVWWVLLAGAVLTGMSLVARKRRKQNA
jgi:hypothetical protein